MGAIVGGGLKLLDTLIMLGTVDPMLAFLFLAAIAVAFIPRVGRIGVIAVVIFSMAYTKAHLFMIGIVAVLTGAILGSLPGMAVGGIIGLSRKNSFPLAKDAEPESSGLLFKATIVPLVLGMALFALYIFVFNPWLMTVLE